MVQGRGVNASLNENGRNQAQLAFGHLRSIGFDHFYSSSLKRTHETLHPFKRPFTEHEAFDEISWGDQEGVVATVEEREVYADTIQGWRKGNLHLSVGGGETPVEVMERQKVGLREVMESEYEKILICMHGRAMRVLLCWMLNYPLNYMDGFPHANCSYYSLNFNGHFFSMNHFNETAHLDG